MAGCGKRDFFDGAEEEDTGSDAKCCDNIRDDGILEGRITHKLEYEQPHTQHNKVGGEGESIA